MGNSEDKLVCPNCGKTEKGKNSRVSRFKGEDDGRMLGHCHSCGTTFPLERETNNQAPRSETIRTWCSRRGIFLPDDYDGPANIVAREFTKDGKTFTYPYLKFTYPSGPVHYCSLTKDSKGSYIQSWDPVGAKSKDLSLFFYQNEGMEDPAPDTAFLCEGEKDALALGCAGFAAFATPGATGATVGRLNWLNAQLDEGIRTVRLVFDNDKAGYDGMVLAGERLADLSSRRVEMLLWDKSTPKKFDICDLSKKCGTVEEFRDRIAELTFDLVMPGSSEEIAGGITRERSGYWRDSKQLSNCILDVLRVSQETDGVSYKVRLISGQKKSPEFYLDAAHLAEPGVFNRKIAAYGPYRYFNKDLESLAHIIGHEVSRPAVASVRRLNGFGWHADERLYAFEDGIVWNGKIYKSSIHGYTDVDGELYETMTVMEFLNGQRPKISGYTNPYESDWKSFAAELFEFSKNLIGSEDTYTGLLMLGWFCAAYYSNVFWRYKLSDNFGKAFPFLHVIGSKGAGKTETIHRYYNIHGYDCHDGDGFSGSTQDYFNKSMEANRDIAMWFEEAATRARIPFGSVKQAYNRGSVGKGTITGTRTRRCNASLILSGEELLPEIQERSVVVSFPHLSERSESNTLAFEWLTENKELLINVGVRLMLERTAAMRDRDAAYLRNVSTWKNAIMGFVPKAPPRLAQNYASVFAGLELLGEPICSELADFKRGEPCNYSDWFRSECRKVSEWKFQNDIISDGVSLFLADPRHHAYVRGGVLSMHAASLNLFLKQLRDFDTDKFYTSLSTAPYWIGYGTYRQPENHAMGWERAGVGKDMRCLKLDATHPSLPDELKLRAYRWNGYAWEEPNSQDQGEFSP